MTGLRPLGQAVNRCGQTWIGAEQAIHGHRSAFGLRADQCEACQLAIRCIGRNRRPPLIGNQDRFIQRLDPAKARRRRLSGARNRAALREQAQHPASAAYAPQQEYQSTRGHRNQQDRARRARSIWPGKRNTGRSNRNEQADPERKLHEIHASALSHFACFSGGILIVSGSGLRLHLKIHWSLYTPVASRQGQASTLRLFRSASLPTQSYGILVYQMWHDKG